MPSPVRSWTDSEGRGWLELDNGARIPLPASTVSGGGAPAHGHSEYVARSGDTMTGVLALAIDPVEPLEAATKQYVDAEVAGVDAITAAEGDTRYVNATGDAMTGPLTLPADPVEPLEAATKQYVDALTGISEAEADLRYINTTGDQMTGVLALAADPLAPLEAATKAYADRAWTRWVGTLAEYNALANVGALDPATLYTVILGAGSAVVASAEPPVIPRAPINETDADLRYINADGDAMTGPLLLAGDPVTVTEAVPKQYADRAWTRWFGTQAQYDALGTHDPSTLYVIEG